MITNHIRTLRRKAALTQRKLAEKSRINQSSLSQMERGAKTVTLTHLFALANAFDCLPSELVNDDAYLATLDSRPTEAAASLQRAHPVTGSTSAGVSA